MLILAVDSATPVAGVALADENKVVAEYFTNYKRAHSENLMPVIDKCLTDCSCSLHDLAAIAVTTGPGSFTGLRIGMATVKGLSLAADVPLIGISTLDALAHNIVFSKYLVCPLLNARKNEVYCAAYDANGSIPQVLWGPKACPPQIAAERFNELAEQRPGIILLGDGYIPYQDCFDQILGNRLNTVPPHQMLPRAASVASLARYKLQKGLFEDAHSIRPYYIRLSEAEYKLGKGDS